MGLTYDGITYRSLEEQVRYDAEQVQLLKQADVTINENLQTINTELDGKLTKPTNPSAESAVVIETDGTALTKTFNEIVSPVVDKPYELIEEITLTEDTAKIDRAGYDLKDVYIYVNVPQYTDTQGITFIVNGGNAITCIDIINKNFNAISALYASIKGGLLFMGYTQNTNSGSNALEYKQGIPFNNVTSINSLTFRQDVGKVMPAGTVIKIYGR